MEIPGKGSAASNPDFMEGLMADTILQRRTFETGQKIFDQGQEGDHAYLVQSGRIEIVKVIEDREEVLDTIGEGGMFGEMALIDDQPRMAMARAAEMTTLIIISRMMIEKKLAKAEPFVRALLKILVGNIRSLSAGLEPRSSDIGDLTETADVVDAEDNPEGEA
jgi:CRP-like cAMP-binding protein